MSDSKPQLCCPNPTCAAPLNPLGTLVCVSCETPLIYRYLWAVGQSVEHPSVGTQVAGRYYVMAPQIWLDTQPSLLPDVPAEWSDEVLPYLHLYPQRLHVPEVYGFCPQTDDALANSLFLLENVPLDAKGKLYPAIAHTWTQATVVRQVYWLWQLLQLWTPLLEQGVVSSLLSANNIRVEGWRVRLCQLFNDADVLAPTEAAEPATPRLADLANRWLEWVASTEPGVAERLQAICHQMREDGSELGTIATQLNQLLLEQAAQLPLRLQIVGATDTGPQRSHNEDACYPTAPAKTRSEPLASHLAIVCDGIGGHEGGEVASQTAVRSLKLQAQALLAEVEAQTELVSPDLLMQQLEASVRVVNNLIASQNDTQGREDRRRMGTTLVMALQVSQRLPAVDGSIGNGHELYLVNVGDSRAYWMTPRYCHLLTVDDDVSAREVRLGRALYREALQRPDAGALTQAIGTRDAEFLQPTTQRLILEEDGILLLCSDGLSDYGLIEQSWAEYTDAILKGKHSLELAAKTWIDLANQKNGHDNTSVVILRCNIWSAVPEPSLPASRRSESEWSPASRALLQDEPPATQQPESAGRVRRSRKVLVVGGLLAALLLGGIGLAAWSQLNPTGFQQFRERVLPRM
ncbi:PP2C family protein-serine/threonine phosphatase [Stenomitos frigidus]|uniref:Serine/threonine protein phosphatase n=1 Tax=Stenomitos frigidus ULC18 TaxID=2107698 RepID=A0A2T1E223_9CYAN|nr:PP2C family serine/threonine-protein phosphatase [Stenomitos frigidus]PSB26751.1 serine/threonine protein phosphatase [Stenomitos frigidus ULC18]